MATLRCPHCDKEIELLSPSDLREDYGYRPNPLELLIKKGEFPAPALTFENRRIWLRSDIDNYSERRNREKAEKLVAEFSETLAALPETERDAAMKLLLNEQGARKRAH